MHMHRPILAAAIVVVASALAGVGAQAPAPDREPQVVGAAALERPNVVLVVTDDQTLESLDRMPFVNGRNDWIRFANASPNVSLCCPARASILSGQSSHHTGVEINDGNPFDDSSTIATWLDAAGYETSLVGKYLNLYGPRLSTHAQPDKNTFGFGNYVPPGWDRWSAFYDGQDYFDYSINHDGATKAYRFRQGDRATWQHYTSDLFSRRAQTIVRGAGAPFFMYLAPNAPHSPWAAAPRHRGALVNAPVARPASIDEADVSDKPAWVRNQPRLGTRGIAREEANRRAHWRALLGVDDSVRDLYATLEETGKLDETVIIFISDNGYAFGEHRLMKKRCPYDECTRIPLLMHVPGVAGRTINQPVSNVDLAATIADLGGTRPEIGQDGRSLMPLIEGTARTWRHSNLLRWQGGSAIGDEGPNPIPEFWALRSERWKYVEYPRTGERELYDLPADRHELVNLAGRVTHVDVQRELAAELVRSREAQPSAVWPSPAEPDGPPILAHVNVPATTATRLVRLDLDAWDASVAGVTQMRLANEDGTWGDWRAWNPAPDHALSASASSLKGVYVQVRDASGAVSAAVYRRVTCTPCS